MPAEWAPHTRCWMAWPRRKAIWGDAMTTAERAYAEVAMAIARFEPVTMVAAPGDEARARARCGPGIGIMTWPIDDSWMRDTGPTFVIDANGELAGVDWRFNAWGGKYDDFDRDAGLAARVLESVGARRFAAPLTLEGGAIHCDGEGTVLATESVLLNANRDGPHSASDIEGRLAEWLGAEKVIWLPAGLAGDETDGHVDNVACFSQPGRVLALIAPALDDPNHGVLQRNREVLEASTDARGRKLQVTAIEQPTQFDGLGKPSAASYINFYVANGGVIAPRFGIAQDAEAAAAIGAAFPGRAVVPVDARPILRGGGGIHCITQQQPEASCDR